MSSENDIIRVVIADDSFVIRRQLEKLCEGLEGVEVAGLAANGAEAITRVQETGAGLLLMDIVMPEVDGLAALERLQLAGSPVRVVILSSLGGSDERAEKAFELGAVQVLPKPIDSEALQKLIETERKIQRL